MKIGPTMLAGVNHVALLTADLDRFIAFYTGVLGATVIFDHVAGDGEYRHAMIDIGGGAALHPFELDGNPHGNGSAAIFARGHIDHLALNVADEATFQTMRGRLVEAGASDGDVTDFGLVKTCFFRDPDGMECEIALWSDGPALPFADRTVEPYAG